ncbi:MAG: hypothetical protein ACI9TY_001539 [Alphaproteobacteria bacterium]|jgi:hypothetical protein
MENPEVKQEYEILKILQPYLTYAGTLPFIFCALSFITNINVIPSLGDTYQVLSIYGLVIASFMAGSHWGQHLSLTDKWAVYLPTLSNSMAVILWISFLLFPFKGFLCVLMISFSTLLFIDKKLFQKNHINSDYFRTRCIATFIVISSLLISGVFV